MEGRIQSLQEFWRHYLGEHRQPMSRRLHFLGTSGFLASVAASTVTSPLAFPAALAGMAALGADAVRAEKKGRSLKHVAGMLALPTLASPVLFPSGVVFAYGCAWAGHYLYEQNRPATFDYPVMSVISDFRMWSHMARGQLWTGEDPHAQLDVDDPERVGAGAGGNGMSTAASTPPAA
jgi:hypothetical protein